MSPVGLTEAKVGTTFDRLVDPVVEAINRCPSILSMKEQRDDEESLTRIHLVIGSSSPVLLLSLMQGYCQRPKISESSEQGPVT